MRALEDLKCFLVEENGQAAVSLLLVKRMNFSRWEVRKYRNIVKNMLPKKIVPLQDTFFPYCLPMTPLPPPPSPSHQIYDATNSTVERRDLIVNHLKEVENAQVTCLTGKS